MFLHAQHAALTYQSLVILADDTDTFIISLGLSSPINSNMYIRRCTKSHVRMIDISRLATVLGGEMCSLLHGLHAWTECDTVSSFANQGKIKAWKILQQHPTYRQAFISLGASWNLTPETSPRLHMPIVLQKHKNNQDQ